MSWISDSHEAALAQRQEWRRDDRHPNQTVNLQFASPVEEAPIPDK